jgi:AcrR family transcriptional regulator
MARKTEVFRKDIIEAAVDIVRTQGSDALNARSLAAKLGCSTQPVFSNFKSMDDLLCAVLERTLEIYNSFVETVVNSNKYETPYKARGMAYILFAMQQTNLFKLLFMRDRKKDEHSGEDDLFDDVLPLIMKANGFTKEQARLFHLEMWITVHGIASMAATGYCTLDPALASRILTDSYQGLIQRFANEKCN